MTELVKSLGINWPVMIAQLVNFAILLFVLARFVYKPVMKLLDERRGGIAQSARREQQIADKLAGMAAEREKLLAEARAESQRIIDEAKKGGEMIQEKMLVKVQAEIVRLRAEAEKRLAGEKAKLIADVRREIGAVVVEAIERSFSDVLDARAQGKMVEQAFAAIREANDSKSQITDPKSQTNPKS